MDEVLKTFPLRLICDESFGIPLGIYGNPLLEQYTIWLIVLQKQAAGQPENPVTGDVKSMTKATTLAQLSHSVPGDIASFMLTTSYYIVSS